MDIKPIADPLPGESLLAVAPTLSPEPEVTWNRRLLLHSGRTLSEIALENEQAERSGRLTLAGQMLSAGVISGLEAGLELDQPADSPPGEEVAVVDYVRVNPGLGLAASGEFVVVAQPMHVEVNALPVNAPVIVLEGGGLPNPGDEAARRLDASLGELKALGRSLPRAGILVLQPVEVQPPSANDPQDPCPVDPEAVAFADLQRVDACRLLLFTWPTETLPLPDADDPTSADWRNRIAYALFEYERNMAPGELWPWQGVGVAVGLLALDAALEPLFLDRYSVVRGGGKARERTPLVDKTRIPTSWREGRRELWQAGSPSLWQARIQQFAEEITAALAAGQPPAEMIARFRFAPPVGLLPATMFDPSTRAFAFFPPTYTVGARPVPVEQIDLAIRESAALAPFADDTPAQVELLVPVPQQWFEPRLLEIEEVSPEFQEAIDEFIARRAELLARRLVVREAASLLTKHLSGEPGVYPDPDPEALDKVEDVQTDPLNPPEPVEPYGIRDGVVEEFEKLRIACFTELDDPNNPIELNQLDAIGLVAYIDSLDKRIRDANDIVDFGFLRVQTNIYRFRQRILGADEALRLATSPVLAAIARGESAYATRQDLQEFLKGVKRDVSNANQFAVQPQGAEALAAPEALSTPAINPTPANLSVGGALAKPAGRVSAATMGIELTRAGVADVEASATRVSLSGTSFAEAALRNEVSFAFSPGVAAAVKTSATDRVGQVIDTGIVALAPPTQNDVIEQSPIVGDIYDFRTFAIAERLPVVPSGDARVAAIATKYDVITAAQNMAIRVADVVVPGFLKNPDEPIDFTRPLVLVTRRLDEITPDDLDKILQKVHDPVPDTSRNEADYFNSGVKATENTVALLRSLEGRIQVYRSVLSKCRETLAKIQAFAAAADLRLKAIGNGLAEARHDVAVARALLAEEQERIARINERRAAILANHVPFLCFRRPRVAQTVVATPARSIDAGFTEAPVTTCLRTDVTTPAEIRRMVDLMRRAPLRWFSEFDGLLDLLDHPQTLLAVLQSAKAAAVYRQLQVTPQFALPFLAASSVSNSVSNVAAVVQTDAAVLRLGQGLDRVFTAQGQAILQFQAQVAAVNLGDFGGLSWRNVRERARDIVTIGDLIDGNHGNSQVARRAADALDNVAHVATCLYAEFSAVPPLQRLRWAELLSQYDAPVPLRNLANLPGWGQSDANAQQQPDSRSRREMQSFVDWLFARINVAEAGAVGLINDLVRVCILLASHAPVNQIIAGTLHETVTAKPGGLVKIAVDPTVVRIGMPVAIYRNQEVVAHAVVSDLIGGLASAEVVKTVQAAVQLDKGMRVQFGAVRNVMRVRG